MEITEDALIDLGFTRDYSDSYILTKNNFVFTFFWDKMNYTNCYIYDNVKEKEIHLDNLKTINQIILLISFLE